jgi:hypothetical protein
VKHKSQTDSGLALSEHPLAGESYPPQGRGISSIVGYRLGIIRNGPHGDGTTPRDYKRHTQGVNFRS